MQIKGIDHVHVEVANRDAAAQWYREMFELQPDKRTAVWAEDPKGPLILSTADGVSVLALFEREVKTSPRDSTIAFRVSGDAFLKFLDRLPALELMDRTGKRVTRDAVVDHQLDFSIYFTDPDGNRFEVTTDDYTRIASTFQK